MRLCDSFVYISQYGVGTASLNVAVAASIVLHHYALWAGYEERSRQGFKYDVAEKPTRTAARGMVPLTEVEREELRAKRAAAGDGHGRSDSNSGSDGEQIDFSSNGLPSI